MKANRVILRKAVASDASLLGEIGLSAWHNSAFGINDAGRTDRDRLLGEFVQFCAQMPETILLAVEGNELLGWGARELPITSFQICGSRPRLGSGVGAALLAALEEAIALEGFEHAELETYAGNAGAVPLLFATGL